MNSKEIEPHNSERLIAVTGFLKWYRINSGLSQFALSKKSGVSRNTISRYESQHLANLTLFTIIKICDALEIDGNEVFQHIQ